MLGFFKKLVSKTADTQAPPSEMDWEELEAMLIQGDFGPRFAMEFVETLRSRRDLLKVAVDLANTDIFKLGQMFREKKQDFAAGSIPDFAARELKALFPPLPATTLQGPPHVVLMVGVNGVGKTTSAAKLAHWHQRQGKRVRLAAADTFRAAAIEQLHTWGERLGIPVTSASYGSDPAAVAYSACDAARQEGADLVIIDTAGRQHNKHNLMQELGKTSRALAKLDPKAPHETLLVVDMHTGGNALHQAKEFSTVVPINGVVATKWDGAGAGGSLAGIAKECGLYPKWVGAGEQADQFSPFDPDAYVARVLSTE